MWCKRNAEVERMQANGLYHEDIGCVISLVLREYGLSLRGMQYYVLNNITKISLP
jgi:hypothetical protein